MLAADEEVGNLSGCLAVPETYGGGEACVSPRVSETTAKLGQIVKLQARVERKRRRKRAGKKRQRKLGNGWGIERDSAVAGCYGAHAKSNK